jgi:hypothetical protein
LGISNRRIILSRLKTYCLICLFLSWPLVIVEAQIETSFQPTDKFSIPNNNGTISFATDGTYSQAILKNGTWDFENLHLNNSESIENLRVSAQDSKVTILSYKTFNSTVLSKRLAYIVEGHGKQTFNLGLEAARSDWSVSFNGKFIAENDGWQIVPDSTLTITGATENVTIYYFNFTGALGVVASNPNLPFYEQHSIAIVTGFVVVVAIAVITMVRRKIRTNDTRSQVDASRSSTSRPMNSWNLWSLTLQSTQI